MLRRVLLVDIEPHVLQVMKSTLDRNGFEVDTAMTVSAARQLYAEYAHQAVVMDGTELDLLAGPLCEEFARLPAESRPLTLLALEGDVDMDIIVHSLPCETLAKPLSLRYLVARLAAHFGCYQLDSSRR